MSNTNFSKEDLDYFEKIGISEQKISNQVELFKKGIPFVNLEKSATINDGISKLNKDDVKNLTILFEKEADKGRMVKFVPASGAASRMFKTLIAFYTKYKNSSKRLTFKEIENNVELVKAFKNLEKFAFFEDLKEVLKKDNLDIFKEIKSENWVLILDYILNESGLNYSKTAKAFIKFHKYEDFVRTAFEEHLEEGLVYAKDNNNELKFAFTINEEYMPKALELVQSFEAKHSVNLDLSLTEQKKSTDTIAVDKNNNIFRTEKGFPLFRPGGHGALIHNLNEINSGDIIFIKNIDNVVPDRLKETTFVYKKALGGLVIKLQNQIFEMINDIHNNNFIIEEIIAKMEKDFCIISPADILYFDLDKQKKWCLSKLNRPIRVCGMVKNEGEPGGGPFWIKDSNGNISLQIVESAQIDKNDKNQLEILQQSTHFNPVDLVCGINNYKNEKFNLLEYVDENAAFISEKSSNGKCLKALELPGLWNGAMAYWTTIFVEVPVITFNPVKIVNDLLRDEHQGYC